MTDNRTNVQIVADALRSMPDAERDDDRDPAVVVAEYAVAALEAAGRLVGPVTEAQVEAAAKAIADCHNPGMFEMYPENWRVEARAAAARALEEFADQMTTGFNAGTLNAERRAIKREARVRAAEIRGGERHEVL